MRENTELSRIKDLLYKCYDMNLSDMVNDIYETYHDAKLLNPNFAKVLNRTLCEKVNNITIDNYYGFGIGTDGVVRLTRFGISLYPRNKKSKLISRYRLTETELRLGHLSLEEYINDFKIGKKEQEIIIRDLETFISHFEDRAKRFFEIAG